MNVNILKQNDLSYPAILKDIPSAPKQLFYVGAAPSEWLKLPRVTIVGSRKLSSYGQEVTRRLATELAQAGVVIISGLALGVDSVAHQAALKAGGITVAVLPTPLDKIYPQSHTNLARQIVEQGGTLISEYPKGMQTFKTSFVARNRIVSGLADIVLITEAAINSGSLHTARFALDQGKTVMAVPGNITGENSGGTNNLIKSGATVVTEVADILFCLNIKPKKLAKTRVFRGRPEEEKILKLIRSGTKNQDELAKKATLSAAQLNFILTILEINGYIRAVGGGNWTSI